MKSIQKEINTYIILSFLILFLLLTLVIDKEMNQSVVPMSKELTQEIVNAKSEQISFWLRERVEDVGALAYEIDELDLNKEEALSFLARIASKNDNYESMGLIDTNGDIYVSDGSKFTVNNRDYYERVLMGDSNFVISNPIKSKSNEKDIVIILYKIESSVEDISYISAAVPIETIKEISEEIKVYNGSSIIYDGEGKPIGGNNLLITSGKVFGFSAPIEFSNGWTIHFNIPSGRLYESSERLKHSVVIIGIIIGSTLVLLLSLFSSSIVKPIKSMEETMGKVEGGNFDIRFTNYRKDELGNLQKGFDRMLDRLYEAKFEKKEIEFKLVQEQINPHFLYNTLDTIKWSAIESNMEEVVELIEALASYFRVGLSSGENYISIREELVHIKIHLKIYESRFEEKIKCEINYKKEILDYKIIKVILQPLVENALNYGRYVDKSEEFKIEIDIFEKKSNLIIEVINKGQGIGLDRMKEIYESLNDQTSSRKIGFGLYSVNQRLKLAFGNDYGLDIYNTCDGVKVLVTSPIIKEDFYV